MVCVIVVGLPFDSVVVKMLKDVTDAVELAEGPPGPEPDGEPDVSVGLLESVEDGDSGEVEIEGELGESVGDGEPEEELKKLGDIEVDKVDSLGAPRML